MTDTTAPRTAAGRLLDLRDRLTEARNREVKAGTMEEYRTFVEIGELADELAAASLSVAEAIEPLLGLVRAGIEALPGLTVAFRRDALAMDEPLSKGRFTLPPATMTITQGGPILGRADVLAVIDKIAAARKP